jgi:hypothetical protein
LALGKSSLGRKRQPDEAQMPALPPAFVVDVGLVADRGWAIVEFNPAWCSGLLVADLAAVLGVQKSACRDATASTRPPLPGSWIEGHSGPAESGTGASELAPNVPNAARTMPGVNSSNPANSRTGNARICPGISSYPNRKAGQLGVRPLRAPCADLTASGIISAN